MSRELKDYYSVKIPFSLKKLLECFVWCEENLGKNEYIDIEAFREIRGRVEVPVFINDYIENSLWCWYKIGEDTIFYFKEKSHATSFGLNFL